MEELACDIKHVLQTQDWSILRKIEAARQRWNSQLESEIQNSISYKRECLEKRTEAANKIAELQSEVQRLNTELDNVHLQQKIVTKKISNVIKQEEQLTAEINTLKAQRDSLVLEKIDLQQEVNNRNERKRALWDAIKRANYYYSEYLDFSINLEEVDGKEHIRVSFFTNNETREEKYYLCMSRHGDHWKVEEIHPVLKEEYVGSIRDVIDINKEFQINNITALLCRLRRIFLKYYVNKQ